MGILKIPVSFDGAATPDDRLVAQTKTEFGASGLGHPEMGQCVAGAETQGLNHVRLCLFCMAGILLTDTNPSMGRGEVSIQRQRVFTVSDALHGAFGEYVENSLR